jgi:ketosteroid isomerase-like protein
MTLLTAEDRWAIGETLSLLGHIVDSGQWDRLEEVFTPDAVYDLSDVGMGAIEGVEAIRQGARQLGARNPVAHHLTNVVITGEDDGAVSVQSKGLLLMADGNVQSLTQHDLVRRLNGSWHISRHVIKAQRAGAR